MFHITKFLNELHSSSFNDPLFFTLFEYDSSFCLRDNKEGIFILLLPYVAGFLSMGH